MSDFRVDSRHVVPLCRTKTLRSQNESRPVDWNGLYKKKEKKSKYCTLINTEKQHWTLGVGRSSREVQTTVCVFGSYCTEQKHTGRRAK